MTPFEIWVYRSAIALLIAIVVYLSKGVLKELRQINKSMQAQAIRETKQDGKISTLECTMKEHKLRLDDHGKRIKDLEIKTK